MIKNRTTADKKKGGTHDDRQDIDIQRQTYQEISRERTPRMTSK